MSFAPWSSAQIEALLAKVRGRVEEELRAMASELGAAAIARRAEAVQAARGMVSFEYQASTAERQVEPGAGGSVPDTGGASATTPHEAPGGVSSAEAQAGADTGDRDVRGAAVSALAGQARAITTATTLAGVLDALAGIVATSTRRSFVVVVQHEAGLVWQSTGCLAADPPRSRRLPIASWPELGEVVERGSRDATALGTLSEEMRALVGVDPAAPGLFAPLVVDGTVVGAIYADQGAGPDDGAPGWRDGICLLADIAGERLEAVTVRQFALAAGVGR